MRENFDILNVHFKIGTPKMSFRRPNFKLECLKLGRLESPLGVPIREIGEK